jgi:hypothetical protein
VTLSVLAVAAAGVGTYFVAASAHDARVADGLRAPLGPSSCAGVASADCASLADAVDAQHRESRLGAIAFASAGAFALGALAAWVLWRPAPEADHAAWVVAPAVGAGGAFVGMGRAF